jgi:hypothetical protein
MNHRIILSHRPTGPIDTRTFSHSDVPIPTHEELQVGEVVVRVMWLSLVRVYGGLQWGVGSWELMWCGVNLVVVGSGDEGMAQRRAE